LQRDAYAVVEVRWTSRALLHLDQLMLAILLAQVKLWVIDEISDGLGSYERAGKASGSLLLLEQGVRLRVSVYSLSSAIPTHYPTSSKPMASLTPTRMHTLACAPR
jgi:hypothetical protein